MKHIAIGALVWLVAMALAVAIAFAETIGM